MSIVPCFGTCVPDKRAFDKSRAKRKNGCKNSPLDFGHPISLEQNWRSNWAPRDQFGRGTCVAFGTIAAIELYRAKRDDMPPERLSEQFLHERILAQHALSEDNEDKVPQGGILLSQAFCSLRDDGFISASTVPYRPRAFGIETSGPQPDAEVISVAKANKFIPRAYGRVGEISGLDDIDVDFFEPAEGVAAKLLNFLAKGLPVVVGVPLFQHASGHSNWTLPAAMRTGSIFCPDDNDAPALAGPREDGHVVCLTGFEPDPDEPMGGWFRFKNSWGLEFACGPSKPNAGNPLTSRGYGRLSATHLNEYCWEYLVPTPRPEAASG